MSEPLTLDSATIDAIAERVAELIGSQLSPPRCLTAAQVADWLGVSTDYVYEHANELGAFPLSDGPKARLRFDAEKLADHFTPRPFTAPEQPDRRRPNRKPPAVELLPIAGRQ
jgi:hypothetical protein